MDEDPKVIATFLNCRSGLIEYAATRVGRQHAEDIVQEAFVKISRIRIDDPKWHTGPRGEIRSLPGYMFGIVRNLCTDLGREVSRQSSQQAPEVAAQNKADGEPSPEDAVAARQQLALFVEALATLPARTREAFSMHRLGDAPLRSVAQALDVSIARADQLVRQAEIKLAQQLPDLAFSRKAGK